MKLILHQREWQVHRSLTAQKCVGMGFESARAFAAKGWQTTLACRSIERAQQARRKIMYNSSSNLLSVHKHIQDVLNTT